MKAYVLLKCRIFACHVSFRVGYSFKLYSWFCTCDINIDRSKMHAIKMSLRGWNNAIIFSSWLNCKFQIGLRPMCLSCGWMYSICIAILLWCMRDETWYDNMFCFKRIEIWKRNECWWRLQICLVEMRSFYVGDWKDSLQRESYVSEITD